MKFAAALTPSIIDSAPIPPKGKSKKLADGEGLYILFKDTGKRYWRLKFRLFGDEQTYSIGTYPAVGVEAARTAAAEARKLIAKGVNPTDTRREEKTKVYVAATTTFGKAGRDFLDMKFRGTLSKATRTKLEWQYQCLAPLFDTPVGTVTARQIIVVLKSIQAKGHREAAHRVGQFANRVFRYALNNYDSSVIAVNPIPDLREVLEKRAAKSLAAITDPKVFGWMMRAIDSDEIGFPNVRHCLQLLARTALRPGELRQGLWTEVDFERAEFRIPASRMKMRREHLVPLSTQAVAILREQQKLTGEGALIFPGLRSGRPISDAAMGIALKNAFFDSKTHTAHGFRSSFSTMLHESGADPAVVELQLSHAKRDKIAGIYDRSQRVPERRALMQTWADMIDAMKKLT